MKKIETNHFGCAHKFFYFKYRFFFIFFPLFLIFEQQGKHIAILWDVFNDVRFVW